MQQNSARRRTRKIVWFNPLFSLNVKSNVAKMFFQLIDTRFPRAIKLHKIFNCNTVKVSYSCIQNKSQIIDGNNKKVTQIKQHHQLECNCRVNTECPLNGDCRKEDVIHKCATLSTFQPQKSVSWPSRGAFKKRRYYNQTQ